MNVNKRDIFFSTHVRYFAITHPVLPQQLYCSDYKKKKIRNAVKTAQCIAKRARCIGKAETRNELAIPQCPRTRF